MNPSGEYFALFIADIYVVLKLPGFGACILIPGKYENVK